MSAGVERWYKREEVSSKFHKLSQYVINDFAHTISLCLFVQ
jgi:hypothetical protein